MQAQLRHPSQKLALSGPSALRISLRQSAKFGLFFGFVFKTGFFCPIRIPLRLRSQSWAQHLLFGSN